MCVWDEEKRKVPNVEKCSVFSSGRLLGMLNPQLHFLTLELSKKMGPLYQYRLIGHRIVIVNDRGLARQVFRDVQGKGNAKALIAATSIIGLRVLAPAAVSIAISWRKTHIERIQHGHR